MKNHSMSPHGLLTIPLPVLRTTSTVKRPFNTVRTPTLPHKKQGAEAAVGSGGTTASPLTHPQHFPRVAWDKQRKQPPPESPSGRWDRAQGGPSPSPPFPPISAGPDDGKILQFPPICSSGGRANRRNCSGHHKFTVFHKGKAQLKKNYNYRRAGGGGRGGGRRRDTVYFVNGVGDCVIGRAAGLGGQPCGTSVTGGSG